MTESTPIIRRATVDDIPAIVAMLADDALGSTRENPADLTAYRAAFARIDADPNQFLAVMEREGAVIGTLQLTFIAGLSRQGMTRALIEAVRIASSERGGGLGHRLLTWAIEEASRRGASMVQLTADASRTDAHRFYQSLGFEPTHLGFKLSVTPADTADAQPALPPGVVCDPELGICTFEGEGLAGASAGTPNLGALSSLGRSGTSESS
ncbi:MAG: GNAT family N-acetyltransferase [Thermomicrobiales bacterium]